jgi:asparagine synthase (glutamine-hydrolysing)
MAAQVGVPARTIIERVCGILGIAGPGAGRDLGPVLDLLRHRGPDGAGSYADVGVALAMRRLAVIDLETGQQPVADESGDVVCVVNGELYDYVEVRRALAGRGHAFASDVDVEIVPHLYEELGERCFERLRGMFGIALWDRRRRRLVLARDRFGIKPLYIAELDGGLAFSSEIRPLLALGADATPDLEAHSDFLSFGYVPGTATAVAGIRALAPGHVLVWEDGRITERSYVDVGPVPSPDLEATIEEAVRIHLRADVPLAVLLSGGLDSSLIGSLAAEHTGTLHTFSVGFGEAGFDELEPAREVARLIGSDHREVIVRPSAADDLPEIVARLEEPLADASAIPLYYVCRAAAEHVKVALAGEGGDEVFGGYARYAWDRYAAWLSRLPTRALSDVLERAPVIGVGARRGGRKHVGRRAVKLLRNAGLPPADRYFAWFALIGDDAKAELLRGGRQRPSARIFSELLEGSPAGLTAMGRRQYVDLRTMLQSDLMLKADRMSMAHSLELRVPLLDNQVVAAGLALPDSEKIRGVETKVAIRGLLEQRLPRSITRRPKQGFEVPIDRWLREDLAELTRDMLSRERVSRRGLFDPNSVDRLVRSHLEGGESRGREVYALLVLELWQEHVLDAAPLSVR